MGLRAARPLGVMDGGEVGTEKHGGIEKSSTGRGEGGEGGSKLMRMRIPCSSGLCTASYAVIASIALHSFTSLAWAFLYNVMS